MTRRTKLSFQSGCDTIYLVLEGYVELNEVVGDVLALYMYFPAKSLNQQGLEEGQLQILKHLRSLDLWKPCVRFLPSRYG